MVENILSSESPVTITLAVMAAGGVVTALVAIFNAKEALRKEFKDDYVTQKVFDATLESIKKALEQVPHVHDCIHRLDRKLDKVIERNARKDDEDE